MIRKCFSYSFLVTVWIGSQLVLLLFNALCKIFQNSVSNIIFLKLSNKISRNFHKKIFVLNLISNHDVQSLKKHLWIIFLWFSSLRDELWRYLNIKDLFLESLHIRCKELSSSTELYCIVVCIANSVAGATCINH